MNIYQLKSIINRLEAEGKPEDSYLIQFYKDLYLQQVQKITDQVKNKLDKETFFKSKPWIDYLTK
jgi:hypothetical protein